LEVIGEGDLTHRVILRTNDTLGDLADSVNDSTDGLKSRILEVKAVQRELDKALSDLGNPEVVAILARQAEALERLRT
jgi:methyl-accepting chemotaxis protein